VLALALAIGGLTIHGATDPDPPKAEAILYGCQKFQNNSMEYGSSYCSGNVIWTPAQYQRVVLTCKVRHNDYVSYHFETDYGNWASAGNWSIRTCDQKGWWHVHLVEVSIQYGPPGWVP